MRCDIIIPVWNQPEATRECIDSIRKHTTCPHRFIIIDNASDRPTEAYLKTLERLEADIVLIRNSENLGFVKAVNQGMRISDGPYVCIMNNDTIATAGWLEEMVEIMEEKPEIGILNPSSNTSGQLPRRDESIDEYSRELKRFEGEIQELYTCRGFCMLLKRKVIEEVGLLDETYQIGYFEETDYCKRAHLKGFVMARAKASYVYHRENMSFKELKNTRQLFNENAKTFFQRWGKPLRVCYFVDEASQAMRVDDIARAVARNGHQILIFLKKGLPWPVTLDHFDIRRVDLGPAFFNVISLYKVLRRKRKKKIDILLSDDRLFGKILKMLKNLHGADVVLSPDRDVLFELLQERSMRA